MPSQSEYPVLQRMERLGWLRSKASPRRGRARKDHLSSARVVTERASLNPQVRIPGPVNELIRTPIRMLRQAQIAKYLNLLYEDAFQDWQKKRHNQLLAIARHALRIEEKRAGPTEYVVSIPRRPSSR